MKRYLIIFALVLVISVLTLFMLTSCNTFEPVRFKDVPEEVNIMYSTMKLYQDAKDKTPVAMTIEKCYKTLHRERCKKEIYGESSVDYSDPTKYRDYNECLKELQ